MATTVRIDIMADNSVAIRSFGETEQAGQRMGRTIQGLAISDVGDRMARNITAPIIGGLALATKEAIKYETAQTNIEKALDLSEAAAGRMADQFLRTAPALGLLPEEMANIATEGGKMGVAAGDVDEFAASIAKVSVALDISAEESTKAMGKISAAFGLPATGINQLAADINALDDRVGGVATEIIDATQRASAMGRMFGVTASEIGAFASTMNKQGISAERIGTSLNKLFDVLNTVRFAAPKTQAALATIGYTAADFEKAVGTQGAAKATQELLGRIAQIPDKAVRGKVLMDIFGRTAADELGTLVTNFGTLGNALDIVGDKQGNLNKFNTEFEKRSQTTAFQIKELKGNLSALGITIGRIILPPLNQMLKVLSPLAVGLAGLASANPQMATVVVGLLAITAAIAPLLIVVGSTMTAIATITPMLGVAAGAVGAISLPVVGVIALLGVLVGTILYVSAHWDSFSSDWQAGANAIAYSVGSVLGGAFTFLRESAGNTWDFLRSGLQNFVSFITPALQLASLPFLKLATDALWSANQIMQTWGLIAPYVRVVASAVTATLNSLGGAIKWAVTGAIQIVTWGANTIGAILSTVGRGLYSIVSWALEPIPGLVMRFINWVGGAINNLATWMYNAGAAIVRALINGINSQFQNAIASFNAQLAQLRAYLPSSDAKRGALSDISTTGRAMMETIASGISSAPVESALNSALGGARGQMTAAAVPAPSRGGGSQITIQYQPTITMGSGGQGNQGTIIDELRRHSGELLDLLEEASSRANRAKF